MKFSCQDKLLPGESYIEKYMNGKRAGFDGVEVNVTIQLPLGKRIKEIKYASDASGLIPSTVCGGYRGWLGHFEKDLRNTAIEDIKEIFSAMEEIGASGFVVPAAYGMFSRKLPPFKPPREEKEDMEILVESLSLLGESAELHKVQVFLEPLNRYEDHMINTVAQGVEIVRAVNHPNICTMMDLFHANMEEADISQSIYANREYIKHFHLADSNRLQPGKGHMDFAKFIKTIREIEFEGYCALECNITGEGLSPLIDTLSLLKSY